MCAAKRAREDATALRGILGELRRQGGHAYLVTLTVPHAIHHDIRDTRKTVAKAWTSVSNGTPWKRFCGTYHVAGVARALEVTHGANGWHPHAHVLLFCRRVLSAGELAEVRAWISERWGVHVQKRGWARPDAEHGVTVKACRTDTYIAKMGLAEELVGGQRKQGRIGGRTPWQIAYDIAHAKLRKLRDPALDRDIAIWKDYARGMRGAQQLTWSRGLRKRYTPAVDTSQCELELGDMRVPREVVLDMPAHVWRDVVRDDVELQVELLAAAELGCKTGELEYLVNRRGYDHGLLLVWTMPPPITKDRRKKTPVALVA